MMETCQLFVNNLDIGPKIALLDYDTFALKKWLVERICNDVKNQIAILRVAEKEPLLFFNWFIKNSKPEGEIAILAIEEFLSQ